MITSRTVSNGKEEFLETSAIVILMQNISSSSRVSFIEQSLPFSYHVKKKSRPQGENFSSEMLNHMCPTNHTSVFTSNKSCMSYVLNVAHMASQM